MSIKISVRRLLEIAKKSKGYSVTLVGGAELSDIQQSKSRSYVDCLINGQSAKFDKDAILTIQD